MLEDMWLHTYYEDPKAVTETVEDDDFDQDAVADELRRMQQKAMPNDFEPLS